MNSLEKKSFYSFVTLYISSSLLFVLLSGFWYYKAQENSLQSTTYYKLQHIADTISGLIINAQMHHKVLNLPKFGKGYEYSLVRVGEKKSFKKRYYQDNSYTVLVSLSPQEHLDIQYVIVKTKTYQRNLKKIQKTVLSIMLIVFILIVIISLILAKLFMKPIHQKVEQIETFIQDISHELNTPITALEMSSKRAIQKKVYDKKILTNILISTKQLYTIYRSLTYLSFSSKPKKLEELNIKKVVQEVIRFYHELCYAKNIEIVSDLNDCTLKIDEERAKLLFSNLLSNAIKYSMPDTTIKIKLNDKNFSIEDEGVGIANKKLDEIFKPYVRSSTLAGGFGIGLSIVKQICDEIGIKIYVKSKLDKGSTFYLDF